MVANLKMIERRKTREMNAVGIDVSKGKSTVVVMRPFGEVVAEPFEVSHTDAELSELACFLGELPGETRIVMEYTGNYWQPIAKALHDAGLFVCVVNALLIYKYGNNSIRKVKTDKLDAVKIANYCLDRWGNLERYTPADQIRQILKTCRRQYDQYIKLKVNLKNNLISLLDGTFPGVNTLFKSAPRDTDGHEKWVDFAENFWHRECVCMKSEQAFTNQYRKWCAKTGYRFSVEKAVAIYAHASSQVNTLPMSDAIKLLVTHAAVQLNTIIKTISTIQHQMLTLASQLPEYPIVMRMFGVAACRRSGCYAHAKHPLLGNRRAKRRRKRRKQTGWESRHFRIASFLRFMAANLSLTQLAT